MTKKVLISPPKEREDGWYFEVGPFETWLDAQQSILGLLKPEADTPPPPLGVNVTETITAADKFG